MTAHAAVAFLVAALVLPAATGEGGAPGERCLRLLVVETRPEADAAIEAARGGVSFEEIVLERSIGPGRAEGGYLGCVDPAGLPPATRAAVAATPAGRLSAVFALPEGYGVVQVLSEREIREREARQREARELLVRGTERGRAGALEEAIQLLQRGVELDPLRADGHFNLAIALQKAGRTDEAVQAMRRAVALHPEDVDAQLRLAGWLLERGQAGEAGERLERAATLRPGTPAVWQRLGEAYEAAGKLQPALRAYRRALELLGRDEPGLVLASYRTAMRAADGPAAVAAARAAKPFRPGHEGFLMLGAALLLAGEAEAAARELEMAVALAPRSVAARLQLAEAYDREGRFDAAAVHLFEAVRLEPQRPEHYRALSRAYRDAGRLDLAIVALRDGIARAAGAAPTVRAEMLRDLATLYERAGMAIEAERERENARALPR